MGVQYLPRFEIFIYFSIYLIFLIYGFYQVFLIGSVLDNNNDYVGYTSGWSFLKRKRDDMDFEWETWKKFIISNCYWFLIHLIASELCRYFKPKLITIIQGVIGVIFVAVNYSIPITILLLLHNFIFFKLIKFKSEKILWGNCIFGMALLNSCKMESIESHLETLFHLNDIRMYMIIMLFSWNLLRCLSFTLDAVTYNENTVKPTVETASNYYDLKAFFAFTFYLPNLFTGPIIIYKRYRNMLHELDDDSKQQQYNKNLIDRLMKLFFSFQRLLFWLLFTDFALHYLYVNNLVYNPQVVLNINLWALYAFGYLMGQFFYNKYFVGYGFGIMMAQFDQIDTPSLPKCIGRIHHYSDMWKYFDNGLYEFLFTYIYSKCCTRESDNLKKIFASFITFTFIYFWHGFYKFILIWSILNFIWLLFEKLLHYICVNGYGKYLSESNTFRLNALIGAQLFIPAAMSSFYFIGGEHIGDIFVQQTYLNWNYQSYLLLSGCCYCIYHTSEIIKRWEKRNKMDKTKVRLDIDESNAKRKVKKM